MQLKSRKREAYSYARLYPGKERTTSREALIQERRDLLEAYFQEKRGLRLVERGLIIREAYIQGKRDLQLREFISGKEGLQLGNLTSREIGIYN